MTPRSGRRFRRRIGRAVAYAIRLDVATLRAAAWAGIALRRLRSAVRTDGLAARPDPAPETPPHAIRGLALIVRVARANCLERSLLLQEWLGAHGDPHTVSIGVKREADGGLAAHAWITAYEDDPAGYVVISTIPPRPQPLAQKGLCK